MFTETDAWVDGAAGVAVPAAGAIDSQVALDATLHMPLAIDEFPALFIAAAFAEGETVLTGAEELRVKESDRIQVMADGLIALGVDARPTPDGMVIKGGPIGSSTVDSHGDHRIAMSFAMAALCANGPIRILDCANVNTSFPCFVALAKGAGLSLKEQG